MKNRRTVHMRTLSVRELAAVAFTEGVAFDALVARLLWRRNPAGAAPEDGRS
ncbi:hypothetical protein [Sinomonas soli]